MIGLTSVINQRLGAPVSEWTQGAVLDEIASVIPDRTMTVCGARRSTFRESAERTRRLANFLASRGLGPSGNAQSCRTGTTC